MKKRLIIAGVVIALLSAGGYWMKNQVAQKTAQMQKATLATTTVKRGQLDLTVGGTASIVPYEKVTVKANVSGTVSQVFVEDGQPVKEGQPIMLISNEALTQALEQARLDYQSQRHTLETMRSPSDVDRAQAESRLQTAQQALENRRRDLEKLDIESPINGRVASVSVNPGDAVAPTQLLLSVVDDTSIYVMAKVPQIDIARVKVGQAVSVTFGTELPSTDGTVDSIGVEATDSPGERTTVVPVSIKVANPTGIYRVGLAANATIRVDEDETVSAPGTVAAKSRYDLRSEITGTIEMVDVRENDTVKAGQLLVRIRNDDFAVALRQAESDLTAATDSLDKIKSGLMPNVTEDDTTQQQFRVRQAELTIQTREVDVRHLEPKAPISGTVISCDVTRGESVLPGTPLFTIADYSRMKMVISVDELDVARVELGQEASVKVEAVGRQYTGVVTRVATEGTVKDGVATYPVEVTLKDTKDLRGAMSGTARIHVASRDNVLMVPSEAVWIEDDRITVQVLRGPTPEPVEVQIGLMGSTYTEIVSGLNEGDIVVLSSTSDMSMFTTTTDPKGGN